MTGSGENLMSREQYVITQEILLGVGAVVEHLDLSGFLACIERAGLAGPILAPGLWLAANDRLQGIRELAEAALEMQHAMRRIRAKAKEVATGGA